MKPYSIEARAKKKYGTTDIFEFAGYLLRNGEMLNFSYEGYQRDEDHRIIGEFYKKASDTDAMLKFMRRGNVRVMCNDNGYRFEYIRPLTAEQNELIMQACKQANSMSLDFTVEIDNDKGYSRKTYNSTEDYMYRKE